MTPVVLALRGLIRAYQWTIAPVLGVNCRFVPSCSEYTCEAIGRHGAIAGAYLGARRLLRCHPWGGSGCDPVPDAPPFSFGRARSCFCTRERTH